MLHHPMIASSLASQFERCCCNMDFVAPISAAILSIKYAKNQIKTACETSRHDFDHDKRILSLFSRQASLSTKDAAPCMTKCFEMCQEHFKLGESILFLKNNPDLSHAEKLDAWSKLFDSALLECCSPHHVSIVSSMTITSTSKMT